MNSATKRVAAVALALLTAVAVGGCARRAEPVSVKSARFTALHEGGSTEVTWDASGADVQRFSEAYASARLLDDHNGTTPPARIDAVLESGESMVVWGGGQGFQTVSLGGQEFNVDSEELHRLLEEIAARTGP